MDCTVAGLNEVNFATLVKIFQNNTGHHRVAEDSEFWDTILTIIHKDEKTAPLVGEWFDVHVAKHSGELIVTYGNLIDGTIYFDNEDTITMSVEEIIDTWGKSIFKAKGWEHHVQEVLKAGYQQINVGTSLFQAAE